MGSDYFILRSENMKVVGVQRKTLQFKDGNSCAGCFIHLTEEREGVQGVAVENIFISAQKLGDYSPQLGDEVNIYYNRYGKVQSIVPKGFSRSDFSMPKE